MKSNFADRTAAPVPANGYKPVMTVNASDNHSDEPTFKTKLLAVLKGIFILFIWIFVVALFLVSVSGFLLYGIPKIQDRQMAYAGIGPVNFAGEEATTAISDEIKIAEKKITGYNKQLLQLIPKTPYLIINTTDNEFDLYSGDQLLRKGRCSTGKNTILKKSDQKKWVFKTPRGAMKVRGKITSPVWVKPDWAFVEEGLPVPSARHPSRYEAGSLGDYALSLGDGYMIHGTLYKRLLGMPVTHGCVRMNDEDLEFVYNTLSIGSKVYIY